MDVFNHVLRESDFFSEKVQEVTHFNEWFEPVRQRKAWCHSIFLCWEQILVRLDGERSLSRHHEHHQELYSVLNEGVVQNLVFVLQCLAQLHVLQRMLFMLNVDNHFWEKSLDKLSCHVKPFEMRLLLYAICQSSLTFKAGVYVAQLDDKSWQDLQECWLQNSRRFSLFIEDDDRTDKLADSVQAELGWLVHRLANEATRYNFSEPANHCPFFWNLVDSALEFGLDVLLLLDREQLLRPFD